MTGGEICAHCTLVGSLRLEMQSLTVFIDVFKVQYIASYNI